MTGIPGIEPDTYVMYRCTRFRRFEKWASGLGIKDPRPPGEPVSWWGPIVMEGNVQQIGFDALRDVCPVNMDESLETGRCIDALPDDFKDAIIQEYLIDGTRAEKAANLGIEPEAFRRRIKTAHAYLLELFNLAAAGLPLEIAHRGPGRPSGQTPRA